MAYKQWKFIAHSLEGGKFKTKVPAESVSDEGPLLGSLMAKLSALPRDGRGSELSGVPFIGALIPFIRLLTPDLIHTGG